MPSKPNEVPPVRRRRILLVDDHPVLRRGLASLIESEPDLMVCGEAATYQAAVDAIQEAQPDLVIVDLSLDGRDGLDLIKQVKATHPHLPTLVLSMHDEELYAERCLRAGARGYVTKDQLDETVTVAIRSLFAGETYMSEKLKARLAIKFVAGQTLEKNSPLQVLSDRELQVFRLIGGGHTTREISKALQLSIKTIETYRENLKRKLDVPSGAALVQRAVQWVGTRASSPGN